MCGCKWFSTDHIESKRRQQRKTGKKTFPCAFLVYPKKKVEKFGKFWKIHNSYGTWRDFFFDSTLAQSKMCRMHNWNLRLKPSSEWMEDEKKNLNHIFPWLIKIWVVESDCKFFIPSIFIQTTDSSQQQAEPQEVRSKQSSQFHLFETFPISFLYFRLFFITLFSFIRSFESITKMNEESRRWTRV